MTRLAIAAATAALVAVPGAAHAAKKPPSTKQAQRAVVAQIERDTDILSARARCTQLTTKRWRCRWRGLNVLGEPLCYGTARVTRLKLAWDAHVVYQSDDVYCTP